MLPHDNRLATSSSATATSAFYAASSGMVPSNDTIKSTVQAGAENGECRLLGPFALFVQGALGILALSVLVFKRWRERPQRPFKIWAFDASKQVVGSSLLHIANLFMSMLSSGGLTPTPKAGDYQANPCSFYLLNLAIDVSSINIIQYTKANAEVDYFGYSNLDLSTSTTHPLLPPDLLRRAIRVH